MKILCINYPDCAPSFIRNGWRRAFEYAGHEWQWWNLKAQPAFDAFRYEPDLFIGTTYELDRATEKCIRSRPDMKVALFASGWGELVDDCPYPVAKVSDEEKRRLEKLKAETGKPDYVFLHVSDPYLDAALGGWRSIGIEPVGILNGFDALLYQGAIARPELSCDVGFVGSRWPYKGVNLDKYILPLLHPNSNLDVKIFGAFGWGGFPQYLGPCSDEINRDIMLSATVCPHVSEPHSHLGFDIPERPYKIMGVGGFCIADPVPEARELFSREELVIAESASDMEALIRHYLHSPAERLSYTEAGQRAVLDRHTYFDRAHKILSQLDVPSNLLVAKERFYESLRSS